LIFLASFHSKKQRLFLKDGRTLPRDRFLRTRDTISAENSPEKPSPGAVFRGFRSNLRAKIQRLIFFFDKKLGGKKKKIRKNEAKMIKKIHFFCESAKIFKNVFK
jgi:hypothetical protein